MLKAAAQTGSATKNSLIQAAFDALRENGFVGTSARTIARRGNFNQALVFYHFGSVKNLLLAALDASSAERMSRYEDAVAAAGNATDLLRVARELYREDVESGHITVLSEMIAGSINDPDLGPQVVARIEPWIGFAERAIRSALEQTGLDRLLPVRELAFAVVSFYIGIDLLTGLDGDRSRLEGLFDMAERFLPLLPQER